MIFTTCCANPASRNSAQIMDAARAGILRKDDDPPPSLGDSVREDLARNLKERNLQFRYKEVENVMAPLIHQVSLFCS